MSIIRVFPRRTKATPDDAWAFVGIPPLWVTGSAMADAVSEVHVSCTFTWDLPEARRLVDAWQFAMPRADVRLGGPALGDRGGEFKPGRYLQHGYVITSRGCPNRCPNCLVPSREGALRTITIRDGWDVLDNNLLACPESHIAGVLDMLRIQRDFCGRAARFTGGLEARRLSAPLVRELLAVRPMVLFLSYDRPAERPHVEEAIARLSESSGWTPGTMRHHVGCYVLVGYEGDTVEAAEERIKWVMSHNVRAYPMFYRGETFSKLPNEWRTLIGGVMSFGGR